MAPLPFENFRKRCEENSRLADSVIYADKRRHTSHTRGRQERVGGYGGESGEKDPTEGDRKIISGPVIAKCNCTGGCVAILPTVQKIWKTDAGARRRFLSRFVTEEAMRTVRHPCGKIE
jgi:hypothetical protein